MWYQPCGELLQRNIVQSMLSKYIRDNIAREKHLCNVGQTDILLQESTQKHSDILSQENQLFEICLVVCFLTVYNITEQSWLGRSAFTACGSTMNRGQHLTEAMACNRHLLQIFMFATVKFKTMLLEFLYLYIISDI